MIRHWWRTPRRSTVVAVEAALAVAAAGVAAQSVAGWIVAGTAAAGGTALFVRLRGRGLVDIARDRLRNPPPGWAESVDRPDAPDMGVAASLHRGLHVVEVPTRGDPLGVVGDGHGFAVALHVAVGAERTWDFADAVRILTEDPARPAAVQLLVEQRRSTGTPLDPEFGPSRTYRHQLPVGSIPLWNRVLLVIRHEPSWAPETVAARGGGAAGARSALTAVAARTIAAAARTGVRLEPVGAGELAELLRETGDPGTEGVEYEDGWASPTAWHAVTAVSADDTATIGRVLRYAAWLNVDRSVLSVTANAIDHSLSAVLRVVAPDDDTGDQAVASLIRDGYATALPGAQEAGLVATLPLGGGARSLADLVNQVRS